MSSSRRGSLPTTLGGALALAAVVAGTLLVQSVTGSSAPPDPPSRPPAAGAQVQDGLPTVPVSALPAEARRVLTLIDGGGPFPYTQDGSVFGNREGLLPPERRGCYREYTVPTPGEDDRGARRVVTSCAGPRYWTADHYESFHRIVPARL